VTLPDATREALARIDPRIVDDATLALGGLYNVLRWRAEGMPAPVFDDMVYVGDERIKSTFLEVLHDIPTPVAHRIIASTVVIGVGIDSLGWVAEHPDLPTAYPVHTLALNCIAPGILCHEAAHVWLSRPLSPKAPRSARERARASEQCQVDLARALVGNGDTAWLEKRSLEPELAADAAATCWLGYQVNTCGQARDERIRDEIYRRAVVNERKD
jgi:hypothetical protein